MTAFICPLCRTPLQKNKNSQICANNHHFDIAKEGYLNLLPVNAKNSKNPGDNKEMMMAMTGILKQQWLFAAGGKNMCPEQPLISWQGTGAALGSWLW